MKNNYQKLDHVMSTSKQRVKGFYKQINGKDVIIYIAKEPYGGINTGDIVTGIVPSVQQKRNLGL